MRVRTAVIPIAGLGTRFLPATKSVPKEMLPDLDRPCVDYIVVKLPMQVLNASSLSQREVRMQWWIILIQPRS